MKRTLKTYAYLILAILSIPVLSIAQNVVAITARDHVVDLSTKEWAYVSSEPGATTGYKEVSGRTDWKPIKVGQRWEVLGHPELDGKTVWVRISFKAPATLKNYKFGFFASMIDDEGVVYVNGDSVGRFKYLTGGKIPAPVDVDLTKKIKWGAINELMVQVRDVVNQRIGGLLGSVCLYKTIPNELTTYGGIKVTGAISEPLAVLLHLGDAQLTRTGRSDFTRSQLASMVTPPSMLRKDELIIVAPAKDVVAKNLLAVELDNIAPVSSNDPLNVTCAALPKKVGQYELLKIPVEIRATFTNPFDPKQITAQAIVETPSGRIEKVYAFFGQDFRQVAIHEEEEILLPVKGNPWKLYYRPREKGIHRVEILVQDKDTMKLIEAGTFEATASDSKGYLSKSKVDSRLYEFDNGDTYFGKGPSGWYRGSRYMFGGNTRWVPLKLVTDYYERKAANGSNFEYLSTFHFGSLYLNGGFIDQHVAWQQEGALRSMEKNGLYWIVFHDGVLRSYQNGFETLPYAAVNGGPCKNIYEVYTNPQALEMQKNELRYMVSRWADSPNLWIWNCGDESQPGTKISQPMVRDWMKELHGYIKQTDIYKHSHSIGEYEVSMLNGGDVILLGDWYYHNNNRGDKYDSLCNGKNSQDAVEYNLCLQDAFKDLKVPVINIEGGICQWENYTWLSGEKYLQFPEALDFHQHLWLSYFTKMAAGGTEWLCQILDRMNELYHAKAMDKYLDGESLTKTYHHTIQPEISKKGLKAFGLQTEDKTLVWINNDFYNWFNIGIQKKPPVPVTNSSINLKVLKDGDYTVELWDTRKGAILKKTRIQSLGNMVNYPLPDIDKDVALKVILNK